MKKITGNNFFAIFFIFIFILISTINISPVKAAEVNNVNVSKTSSSVNYLALGDSISCGMSANSGKGYVDLFNKYLKSLGRYEEVNLQNLSVLGDNSSDLLAKLQTNEYKEAVKNAKIITISIGGNNLLSPVIEAVCQAFGVNRENNPNYQVELASAIESNPNKDAILAGIVSSGTLLQNLSSGILQFKSDFPKIIETIKTLSPESEIYVLTLYNPFNSQDSMYSKFDLLINTINNTIISQSNKCSIVDVYKDFKTTSGAVNFSLSDLNIDPHPTTIGHAAIYDCLVDAKTKKDGSVAANKKWTITFTGEVGYDDSTKNAIVVTDGEGNKVNTTLELGEDNKSIIVYPPTTGYTEGKSYILTVGKQCHDKNGKQMKHDRILNFSIETSSAD
ncbi:GDSL-type esterase/lipase family protein [Clostridium sp.]|uniref:GDSL-type esterase/lipase family protein n=1 Tax=Clostridium sp. TaxID=1506 RepID=UPI002FDECCDD